MSSADSNDVTFEDVVRYIHKGGATLIDVRNTDEVQEHGRIPTANLLPLPELNNALALSNEEFQAKYGFAKPAKDSALVTYCMKGGRAEQARNIFQSLGYTSAKRFPGSWTEWLNRQPEVKQVLEIKNPKAQCGCTS